MPTRVEWVMTNLKYEFESLEHSALDGGQQRIHKVAEILLDHLRLESEENLSPAGSLFALVAMLRASKMTFCIAQGTDTSLLRDILLNDVQVHLV